MLNKEGFKNVQFEKNNTKQNGQRNMHVSRGDTYNIWQIILFLQSTNHH